MTTQTVDSMIASFPNTKISSSDEEPTCNLSKIGEKEMIENITSIRSELGGGQHGYLGLMLSTAKHNEITGFYFTPHAIGGVNMGVQSRRSYQPKPIFSSESRH